MRRMAPIGSKVSLSCNGAAFKQVLQATDAEDLDLDIFQAAAAVEIAGRMLDRLQNNPKTRSLGFVVLATTAHMYGIMSARPMTCRRASASHVDYVNVIFAAISAFTRFGSAVSST